MINVIETPMAEGLCRRVERIAADNQFPLFAVYLTLVRLALCRWSGRGDLVLTASAPGKRAEPVPLRDPLDLASPFLDVVAGQCLSLQRQFGQLASGDGEGLAPCREDPSPMLSFSFGEPDELVNVGPDSGDLWIHVFHGPGGGRVTWAFNRGVFSAATVERLTTSFSELLDQVTADPHQPCAGAGTAASGTVVDLVEAHALHFPARTAVAAPDGELTYAQLVMHSHQVAAALEPFRLPYDRPVAVLMPRSAQQVAVMLGVMRSGRPYLCLDEEAPTERWTALLRQSGALLIVVAPEYVGKLDAPVPVLTADHALTTPNAPPVRRPGPLDLAYLLFTSGSTGEPKGVPIRHESLAAYCRSMTDLIGTAPDGLTYASVTSLSTDLGNTALFGALTSGGRVHLVDRATCRDPFAFADYLSGCHIEVLKITPSHLGALLEARNAAALPEKVVILGGERLPWSLADEVFHLGRCRVINHYGPTEATIGCLAYEVRPNDPLRSQTASVPIGWPLAGAEARIDPPEGTAVAADDLGELAVAGIGVCHGYWNRPDITESRFESDRCGRRWYRSGDLVRRLPSGAFEYLGRTDDQVKIRGYRVEPAEPEAVLAAHPAVRAVAVLPTPHDVPRLRAFVVLNSDHETSVPELREYMRAKLQDYLIPAVVTILERFPYSASGKIDRKALQQME